MLCFFFSSRRRHTRLQGDWSSDVCSSDLGLGGWFFAITINYVEPSGSFAPAVTFSVWVMVIVGGSGNHRGAIIGAFVIYGLEWLSVQLKDLAPKFLADTIPYIRLMLVGVL